jgi:hypothetical protein
VNVVADTPLFGQGDTEARPNPDPSAASTKEAAAARIAPAKIAGHDTAETADSCVPSVLERVPGRCWVNVSMKNSPSPWLPLTGAAEID